MEFEIIDVKKIPEYLRHINPIPFSSEFRHFCKMRYDATGIFVGIKLGGKLKLIMPVFLHSNDRLKTADIPHSSYYSELVLLDNNFVFDLAAIKDGLFRFLKIDLIRFNILDYADRLKIKNYPVKFVAIILDIGNYESADDLFRRAVHLRRRNQIRFALKQNFHSQLLGSEGLPEFYDLYKAHHQQRNFPIRGIDELRNIFIAFGDKAKIVAAYKDNRMVAANLIVIDGSYLWMLINVSDYSLSYYQVNNFVYWRAIEIGFLRGVKYVDFGGTPTGDTGNIHFKKGFGVKLYPIYSPTYFLGNLAHFRYWFARKIWHMKLRLQVVKNWLTKKL